MEISVVERKGKTYTRFKITQKEMREAFIKRMVKGLKPIKENSRVDYFETERLTARSVEVLKYEAYKN